MSGFLLDTNVISEIVKPVPEARVIGFLTSQPDLWLSTIVLHELEFGLNMLPLGPRRDQLSKALREFMATYSDRVLPLGCIEATQASLFRARSYRSGRILHLADALIAGTARVHHLSLLTRKVADFDGLEVDVTNPWGKI